MTSGEPDPTEKFGSSSGRVLGWIGLAFGVFAVVMVLQDWPSRSALASLLIVLLVMVVVWSVMLRPAVFLDEATLRLRNGFSDVRIPLASVDAVVIRQVLVVHTKDGGPSFRSTALTRTRREMMRHDTGKAQHNPAENYADLVEERIHVRSDHARARGVEAGDPVRTPAWPELGVILALATGALVVLLTG